MIYKSIHTLILLCWIILTTSPVFHIHTAIPEIPYIYTDNKLYEIDIKGTEKSFTITINRINYEYDVYFHNGQKAGIYIEYPIITGLSDSDIQDRINTIIKNEIVETNKNILAPDTIVEGKVYITHANQGLINIAYYMYYDHISAAHPVSYFYGLNIDLRKGEKIHLLDFMDVDERLLYRTDDNPTSMEDHWKSEVRLPFHMFLDAYAIYDSEEDKDAYHWRSKDDAINDLLGYEGGKCWYIAENKDIVFTFLSNWIAIPYRNLSDLIYPEYYAILETSD